MRFLHVYPFEVFEFIKLGETVYMLDKRRRRVGRTDRLSAKKLARIIAAAQSEPDRFEFWRESGKGSGKGFENTSGEA